MNKTILSLLVGILMLAMVKVAKATDILSWDIWEVKAASDTIVGPVYVSEVWLSSPTENSTGNWGVLIDSPIATANAPFTAYTSAQKGSPAFVFTSTTAINSNVNLGAWQAADWGEHGVRFSSACTVYKTQTSSGEAFKMFLKIRR